jgi:hypothetical protein
MKPQCCNCGETIESYYVGGNHWEWIHPDLVDLDCHGTKCRDEEENCAEPFPSVPKNKKIYLETYV